MNRIEGQLARQMSPRELGVDHAEHIEEVISDRVFQSLKSKGWSEEEIFHISENETSVRAQREIEELCSDFNLSPDEISDDEMQYLVFLYKKAESDFYAQHDSEVVSLEERKQFIESRTFEPLMVGSLRKLEILLGNLEAESGSEKQKQHALEIMQSMSQVGSKAGSVDEQTRAKVWTILIEKYKAFRDKKGSESDILSNTIREVIEQYSDFVEDEIIVREQQQRRDSGKNVSWDALTTEMYGRSPEELEEIKKRNRENVALEIQKIADEGDITIEKLLHLHQVNNRGIVPKKASKMRTGEEGIMTYFKRVGLHGKDIQLEMDALMDRANQLIDTDIVKGKNSAVYGLEVAKMHNDLLSIHPFPDRNGSTALMFAEVMMARKGYAPQSERKGYYETVQDVFGANVPAMALVGYEHVSMKHIPGYFQGQYSRENSSIYDNILAAHIKNRKERIQAKKDKKKQA